MPAEVREAADDSLGSDLPVAAIVGSTIGGVALILFIVVAVVVTRQVLRSKTEDILAAKTDDAPGEDRAAGDAGFFVGGPGDSPSDDMLADALQRITNGIASGTSDATLLRTMREAEDIVLSAQPARPHAGFVTLLRALAQPQAATLHPRVVRDGALVASLLAVHAASQSATNRLGFEATTKIEWLADAAELRHRSRSGKWRHNLNGLEFAVDVIEEATLTLPTVVRSSIGDDIADVLVAVGHVVLGDPMPLWELVKRTVRDAQVETALAQHWFVQVATHAMVRPDQPSQHPLARTLLLDTPLPSGANWHAVFQRLLLVDRIATSPDTAGGTGPFVSLVVEFLRDTKLSQHPAWQIREKMAETVLLFVATSSVPAVAERCAHLAAEMTVRETDERVRHTLACARDPEKAATEAALQRVLLAHVAAVRAAAAHAVHQLRLDAAHYGKSVTAPRPNDGADSSPHLERLPDCGFGADPAAMALGQPMRDSETQSAMRRATAAFDTADAALGRAEALFQSIGVDVALLHEELGAIEARVGAVETKVDSLVSSTSSQFDSLHGTIDQLRGELRQQQSVVLAMIGGFVPVERGNDEILSTEIANVHREICAAAERAGCYGAADRGGVGPTTASPHGAKIRRLTARIDTAVHELLSAERQSRAVNVADATHATATARAATARSHSVVSIASTDSDGRPTGGDGSGTFCHVASMPTGRRYRSLVIGEQRHQLRFLMLADVCSALRSALELVGTATGSFGAANCMDGYFAEATGRLELAFGKLDVPFAADGGEDEADYASDCVHPMSPPHSRLAADGARASDIDPKQLTYPFAGPDGHLGQGSFGVVMKAQLAGRDVAVKVIRVESESMAAMARREAQLQSRFFHPNVCALYGVATSQQNISLVLELCEGGSLAELAFDKARDFPPEQRLKMSQQLASAMHYLHSATRDPETGAPVKVLHGDLKPHNVLLDSAGNAKLTDFGQATLRSSSLSYGMSMTEKRRGTIGYESPEGHRRERLSTRADVFTFGTVLLEVWTREHAFGSAEFEKCVCGKDSDAAGADEALKAKLDTMMEGTALAEAPVVARVIRHCWRHNPAERPSFAEIVALLASASRSAGHHRIRRKPQHADGTAAAAAAAPDDAVHEDAEDDALQMSFSSMIEHGDGLGHSGRIAAL